LTTQNLDKKGVISLGDQEEESREEEEVDLKQNCRCHQSYAPL
jgi:hypothetical protein